MSVDNVVLWHGPLQALKDDQKKDFVDLATCIERNYAGTYKQTERRFKRLLSRMGATGAYYFDHSIIGQNIHYFKGYPVMEKK